MWSIFLRTINDRIKIMLLYIVSGVGLLWMYIALFPAFKNQSAGIESMMSAFPESFMKAFNFDVKSFTTVEGFISTEQFSFVWPLLVMFIAIGFSGSVLAGDIEKGTMELMLSQPISRIKQFFARYLAGLFMLLIFVFISVLSAIPLCEIYDINYQFDNFITMLVLSILFSWAVFGLALLFSTIFSDKGKVFFASGMVLVVMYVINIVSALKDSLSDLKYFSFFYYFNPPKALVQNSIDSWSYLVFGAVILITTLYGALYFNRRDINY